MRFFRLTRPECRYCGTADCVRLVWTWRNIARGVLAIMVAFFAADLVALEWRCTQTGKRFKARS